MPSKKKQANAVTNPEPQQILDMITKVRNQRADLVRQHAFLVNAIAEANGAEKMLQDMLNQAAKVESDAAESAKSAG